MKKIVALALMTLLSACEPAPASYQPEPFAFELGQSAPIAINVAEIKVVEGYQSPLRKPNVEQDFPVPPATAVKKWVAARLKAVGTSGVLEVTINDASAKEVPLPKTSGVKGLFTDDQDARYDASLAVTFSLYTGARGMSDASGDVRITRSHSINEKATVVDHQKLYHRMTRDMMVSFDSEANARLRQYFAAYLK